MCCYRNPFRFCIEGSLFITAGKKTEINLKMIAELTGLCDVSEVNLKNTVETNIPETLKEHGYVCGILYYPQIERL